MSGKNNNSLKNNNFKLELKNLHYEVSLRRVEKLRGGENNKSSASHPLYPPVLTLEVPGWCSFSNDPWAHRRI